MGGADLRQLLKSLCSNSVWDYAVLWKLRPGCPMILTWEDGYLSYQKPRELVQAIPDDDYCKGANNLFSPQFDTNASGGISEEYPVGLAVADMSCLQYVLGEGVVGRVAAIRDHYWVSFSQLFTGKVKSISEFPAEWLVQFASGIKTILLVPVLPHGVLQLGSLEEIAEDANIVTYAKGKFNRLHNFGENTVPFTLKEEYQSQQSSPLIYSSIELLNEPSSSAFISMKTEYLDHLLTSNIFEQEDATFQPPLTFQNTLFPTGGDIAETFASEIDNEIDHIPFAEVPSPSISMTTSQLETAESKLLELSCLMEELEAYSEDLQGNSDNNYCNVGVLGECFNEVMNVYPASASNMAWEPFCGKYTDNKLVSSLLDFPKDSELHKALEPASRKQTNEKLWDLSRLVDNTCSTLPSKTDPSWFAKGEAEYLLEAVVANACSISDVITLKKSTSFNSYDNFSGYTSTSVRPKEHQKASALVKDNSKPQNRLTSSCIAEDKDADSSSDSLKTMMSTIINKHVEIKSCTAEPKKGRKTVNSSKRRVRVGDNQKPRPRDRQLIQDRVKELREMVPNSAKCSIDGLLERTITHMMYLRSITNQAEKLRNCVHQEVAGRKNWRSFETKENDQNGTSWGFEIGNEFQVCPISVEDLPHPGQMVIEMLCNDHGLFLEIAQVIRNLELTILKGVLKSRSNNTWAHFVVEASKGFHRLDIFWPLMQLLQRKRKSDAFSFWRKINLKPEI